MDSGGRSANLLVLSVRTEARATSRPVRVSVSQDSWDSSAKTVSLHQISEIKTKKSFNKPNAVADLNADDNMFNEAYNIFFYCLFKLKFEKTTIKMIMLYVTLGF